MGVAHTFVEVWEGVAALVAEMDVLLGFAEVAVNAPTPYVRPQMLPPDDGQLKLVGCRFVPAFSSPALFDNHDRNVHRYASRGVPALDTLQCCSF